jgi:hypothetical protein
MMVVLILIILIIKIQSAGCLNSQAKSQFWRFYDTDELPFFSGAQAT